MKTEKEQDLKKINEYKLKNYKTTINQCAKSMNVGHVYVHELIDKSFENGIEFALSELRKPSEDLVQEIESVIRLNTIEQFCDSSDDIIPYEPDYVLPESRFGIVSQEIAKLLPSSRNKGNDVNVRLLESAKAARLLLIEHGNRNGSVCQNLLKAITNAEKQINQQI